MPENSSRFLPVNRLVVALRGDDFWSEVVRRAAKRPGDIWHIFGEAKISDLDMTMTIEEKIFGLEISVDDVLSVEVFQCKGNLCGVEFSDWVREALNLSV